MFPFSCLYLMLKGDIEICNLVLTLISKKIEKCKTLKDDYYKYVEFGSEIPRQGWKIHISSNLDSYQIVLRLNR